MCILDISVLLLSNWHDFEPDGEYEPQLIGWK